MFDKKGNVYAKSYFEPELGFIVLNDTTETEAHDIQHNDSTYLAQNNAHVLL